MSAAAVVAAAVVVGAAVVGATVGAAAAASPPLLLLLLLWLRCFDYHSVPLADLVAVDSLLLFAKLKVHAIGISSSTHRFSSQNAHCRPVHRQDRAAVHELAPVRREACAASTSRRSE